MFLYLSTVLVNILCTSCVLCDPCDRSQHFDDLTCLVVLVSFSLPPSQRCCTSLAPLGWMCFLQFPFAHLAELLHLRCPCLAACHGLELRNVFFGPLTVRTCRLHHRFFSVRQLAAVHHALCCLLRCLGLRLLSHVLTVTPLVSGSPLRFSSWSSCLHAMVRLYGVSINGTAAVSSSSASSLPSLLHVSSISSHCTWPSRFFCP